MTPAEIYAQKRSQTAALIRRYTPDDDLHNELIARVRPAIAFDSKRSRDAEIAIGASKFGGAPDVPLGFDWPLAQGRKLDFLAQLDLEEIAPLDIERILPAKGLLSFFAPLLTEEHAPPVEVFHFARADKRASVPVQPYEFKVVKLVPRLIASALNISCAEYREAEGERELRGRGDDFDLPHELWPSDKYQMLGYPDSVQHDVRYEAGGDDWREWRLLFQINGDDEAETMWDDSGMLYWTIRAHDLEAGNFSDCRFHFQSC